MKLETHIYGWLLQAYPKDFRLEFSQELQQVFRLELENAHLERKTLMFWISTVFDCLSNATRERFFGKGNAMNWLQKLGAISSFFIGFETLAYIVLKLLHVEFISSMEFISLTSKINPVMHRILLFFLGVGIILALPLQKNRVESFGIGAFSIGWIYCALILLSYSPDDPNINLTIIGIFSALLCVGVLAIIFARVKFLQGKILWSEMPLVARTLIVATLCNWLLPTVFEALLTIQSNVYSVLTPSITILGWMALAFGIWHSKLSQPSTTNLISS